MVETTTGNDRSNGISYNELLKSDTVPPPAVYLEDSPLEAGVTSIDGTLFLPGRTRPGSRTVVETGLADGLPRSDIPNVSDTHVYDIAELSYIVVRVAEDQVKAFPGTACIVDGPYATIIEKGESVSLPLPRLVVAS